MFRREWRRQALVLAMLTVAVASAIGFATAAYNVAPAADDAVFGTADRFIRLEGSDPRILQDDVAAEEEWFGVIDVISHRSVAIPGSVESVEFRAQDRAVPTALRRSRWSRAATRRTSPRSR